MDNLVSISNQLEQELDGLENNFSEQLGRLKTFEALTVKRISRLRKLLGGNVDSQWAYQLPGMIDILAEVRRAIEQMEGICLPEDEITFESLDDISEEDVIL